VRSASIALAALACASVFAAAAPERASAGTIAQAGAAAPNFSLSLIANGRGTVALSQLKGRAVYLNFFASWCQPCKAEVPSIAQLSKEYAKRGVVVIGVDELEGLDAVRSFVAHFGLPYEIGVDDSGEIGAAYGLRGLPLHVFIDASGKVTALHPGEMNADQIRAALNRIARK